jgi:hypothetical protein
MMVAALLICGLLSVLWCASIVVVVAWLIF